MSVSWRPLDTETVADWTELVNTLAKADGTEEYYQAEDLLEELTEFGFDPAQDSVAAWQDGRLVGFGKLGTSGNRDRQGRVTVRIEGGVHPDYRGQGLGRQIMDRLEARGRQAAAQRHPGAEVWLAAPGRLPGASVRALLEHRGYRLARYFHQLERSLDGELPPAPAAEVQAYRPELADAIRLAHNDAFAEHWGSAPRTVEHWRDVVESRTFRWQCSFVNVAADGAVDAYVMAFSYVPGELYIGLVGTRPRARGRGLARACMAATLRAAAADGLHKVALSVDSENGTGAGRLYESMGFTRVRTAAAYRKLVPPLAG